MGRGKHPPPLFSFSLALNLCYTNLLKKRTAKIAALDAYVKQLLVGWRVKPNAKDAFLTI